MKPPPSFLLLVLEVLSSDPASARTAIATVAEVLDDLRAGLVRDLRGTRGDEQDVSIDAETVDWLIGYGAALFDPSRGLTAADRPKLLVELEGEGWPFAQLAWAGGGNSGGEGDLCIQLTGHSEHAVGRAGVEIWKAIVDHDLPLRISASFPGFARDDRRSWIGFHDGVSNIRPSQRLVAVEAAGDPEWNRGGSYMAFLRCEVDLAAWRQLTRSEQELLVGRDKLSGVALEAAEVDRGELQPRPYSLCPGHAQADSSATEVFRDPPETGDAVIEASHIHRANQNRTEPTTHASHRIFRQGYEFLDRIAGTPVLGLNFVSFQADLGHFWQVVGLSDWLGGANFGGREQRGSLEPPPIELLRLQAGGLFAVPPRADPFPGESLFGGR